MVPHQGRRHPPTRHEEQVTRHLEAYTEHPALGRFAAPEYRSFRRLGRPRGRGGRAAGAGPGLSAAPPSLGSRVGDRGRRRPRPARLRPSGGRAHHGRDDGRQPPLTSSAGASGAPARTHLLPPLPRSRSGHRARGGGVRHHPPGTCGTGTARTPASVTVIHLEPADTPTSADLRRVSPPERANVRPMRRRRDSVEAGQIRDADEQPLGTEQPRRRLAPGVFVCVLEELLPGRPQSGRGLGHRLGR